MQEANRRNNRWLTIFLSALLLFAVVIAGCGKEEENNQAEQNDPLAQFPGVTLPYEIDEDAVLAEYEGGQVTAKEFEEFLRTLNFLQPGLGQTLPMIDQSMLESYVREYTGSVILANRADEQMVQEAKQQAEQMFDRYKQDYTSLLNDEEASFDKLLDQQKINKDLVVEQMTRINASIIQLRSEISEEELKQRYDETDKTELTTASVRHILISNDTRSDEEAKKLADELAKRLREGEDFAQLAKEYSEDPGSKDTGGLYEDVNVNTWVPEFKEAALTLPIGEVSDPVKTDFGYHVMKVEKRTVASFEEAKETLRETVLQEKYGSFIQDELDKLVSKWNYPQIKEQNS